MVTVMTLRATILPTESLNSPRMREAGEVKRKVKRILINFFDIKKTVHKEFVLACHTVKSAYYCDASWRLPENAQRLDPELWRQKNWLLHNDNVPSHTSFFTGEFFYQKQHDSFSTHLTFVSPIEDKTDGPPF
jgi:hypothetical protein